MKKIIYVPLEHIEQRYTVHLDNDIVNYLNENKIDYLKIDAPKLSGELKPGMFLDASGTIQTKSHQIYQIAKLYEDGKVDDNTVFFFSDLWFPGIESLAYLNYFYKVKPKITGVIHAGSFTDTDFVRDMERWAKNFEDIIFDIADTIYIGSEFIKNDIIKKRIIDQRKLIVTPLPLDSSLSNYQNNRQKEDIIIFNGRLCDEKQPWLFNELTQRNTYRGWKFISTQSNNLSKNEYYKLLAKSKVVVSFALQENFGYGIAEAVSLGCIPIVPNKLVYPEMYSKEYLYNSFEDCEYILNDAMSGRLNVPQLNITKPFNTWFL
jgi:hypothetical protein